MNHVEKAIKKALVQLQRAVAIDLRTDGTPTGTKRANKVVELIDNAITTLEEAFEHD